MSESNDNPWVTSLDVQEQEDVPQETEQHGGEFVGAERPQPGIESQFPPLPVRDTTENAPVWWLGTHGGAGESTLSALLPGSRGAGHAWPRSVSAPFPPRVVLVARTNAHGLRTAQGAMVEWAAGGVQAELLGLVLVSDSPGRLPRRLREYCHLLSGGVPRTWYVPWIERWRLGEEPALTGSPRAVQRVIADVTGLIQGAA